MEEVPGPVFIRKSSVKVPLKSGEAKTLQKMARQRRIPGKQVGDLWRFRASQLDEWLRSPVSSESHLCRN